MKNGRKHKKLIAVLLCLSLIAILLIGCDSSRSRKTSSSNELIENDKEDENGMNRNKHIELFDGINATIKEDGSIYIWGADDSFTDTASLKNAVSVSVGKAHIGVITQEGSLYMWGDNSCGQLGNGTTRGTLEPKKIMDNVSYVELGRYHSGAVTTDGELYMWGDPYKGAIGYGESNNKDTMYPLQIMTNIKFSELSLGDSYSSAVTEDGTLYMWGNNEDCRLGVDNYGKGEGNEASRSAYYAPVKLMDGIKVK